MIEKILERARAELFNLTFHKSERCKGFNDGIHTVMKIIQEESKNDGWIPCSEKMPNWEEYQKNDGRFIVTDGNRVYQSIFDIYANSGFRTLKLFHFVGGTQTANFEVDNCVIAWQPLPAPYQKGE